ncbi:MAG: flagellar biosynthesis anti-sigma factor FlgM [Thermovenabulum sp.]|uniref:flagellar biosynthesis anti-sigma factor FlgM n=1 Tax=Thermovenabulum sp. TaxID=3100335 RepID=UPI003C7E67A5
MNIQKSGFPGIFKIYEAFAKKEVAKADEKRDVKARKDELTLSPEGMEFLKALEIAKRVSDVREDKVREIKERIENGLYTVDAEKIAEKVIDDILNERI